MNVLKDISHHFVETNNEKEEILIKLFEFEDQYLKKQPLTVVRPGSQSRRFTHIYDTIQICYYAWNNNRCRHYSISNKKSYTIFSK